MATDSELDELDADGGWVPCNMYDLARVALGRRNSVFDGCFCVVCDTRGKDWIGSVARVRLGRTADFLMPYLHCR